MDISELLAFSVKNKASDLHLSAGLPPMIRVHGDVRRINLPPMEHKDVHAMVYDIMNDGQRKFYEENLECDFSFAIPNLARFRVNAFVQQRGAGHAPAASHPSWQPHPIQGWTPDFIPYVLQEAIDKHLYDELIPVAGPDAIEWSRKLAQKEGIFTGISGGGTFAIAMQKAATAAPGSVILCMLPDTGERYLSTPLFEGVEEGSDDAWLAAL